MELSNEAVYTATNDTTTTTTKKNTTTTTTTIEAARQLIGGFELLHIGSEAAEAELAPVVETLEGVEGLLASLPPDGRSSATAGSSFVPVAANCHSAIGISVDEQDGLMFAVRLGIGSATGSKAETRKFFSARQAVSQAVSVAAQSQQEHQQVPLTAEEMRLAAEATPHDADFALRAGPFGGVSDLDAEGLAGNPHDVVALTYLSELPAEIAERGGSEDAYSHASATVTTLQGLPDSFDPGRAAELSGELGAELVGLAQEVANTLGAEASPEQFLDELYRRQAGELTHEDRAVLTRARRLGGLAEPQREVASVCRLADHARAHLRLVGEVGKPGEGELLLVPAGTPEEAVHEAAARCRTARAHRQGRQARDEDMRSHEALSARATDRLSRGPASLAGVLGSLGVVGAQEGKDLLRRLVRAGRLECRKVTGTMILARPGESPEAYRRAAQVAARVTREAARNVQRAAKEGKRFAAGCWIAPERESGPDPRGASVPKEYLQAERRDAQVSTRTGRMLAPSRSPRQREVARKRVQEALRRGALSSRERAWNTALSIHLGTIEDPAERLELVLWGRGRQKWSKLEAGATNPAELKAAARRLKDAGRLRLGRSRQEGGELYIQATRPLEDARRAEVERALLRLMVLGRVPVPRGSRLARRVAAHKGHLRREAGAA